jgi:hypothetical protein
VTCKCEQCSKDPDPTYTENFRHLKEVEFVSEKEGIWIKNYLEKIKEKRGFDGYKKLRDDVAKEWKKSRNN